MRIRKNARLILGGGSSAPSSSSLTPSPTSFLVCKLNRSPWDVLDTFSLQGESDDSFGLNNANAGSYFANSTPASDSIPSGDSVDLSFEYVEKSALLTPIPKRERKEEEIGRIEEDIRWDPPPPPPAPPVPKRRGRPRKPTTATTTPSNPYDFYYYSGFGPKWGRRRGGEMSSNTNIDNHLNTGVLSGELDYIDDDEEEDEEDERELYGGSGLRPGRKLVKARSLKSLM